MKKEVNPHQFFINHCFWINFNVDSVEKITRTTLPLNMIFKT